MLGIYGVPAALGAPANINVLTTYIFQLTAWSPPLYNTAAAVAILLMVVTAILVWAQQEVLSGKSYATVAGKAFRPRSCLGLGAGSLRFATTIWHRRGAADAGTDHRGLPQVPVLQELRRAVRLERTAGARTGARQSATIVDCHPKVGVITA
jgi:hypothetical protein